jgi:3'-phosphoadenosine 5'-phosphosulfate sulfotransferase (PAPS reductase)/FAD synthetase
MMPFLVEPVEMKKRLVLRSVFSPIVMNLVSGIQKIKDLRFGLFLMVRSTKGNTSEFSHLSNWTELDVWEYIRMRNIDLPSLYFAHEREVFERNGALYSTMDFMELLPEEKPFKAMVRFPYHGRCYLYWCC